MIADRNEGIRVHGTTTGERTVMGIAEDDMGHVMGVLTDLYSNKVRAVIREYTTNGRDAHVDAGIARPVDVTLPSMTKPFFKVRDYGSGLSHDDIREVYARYGRSTKRESNDMVGALGLGCKSALTYGPQFVVTSICDGVKIVVEIHREDDGAGVMTVVDTSASDAPSGTEILITVPQGDIQKFTREAADFFKVWTPGTVLIDGKAPVSFKGNALRLSDDLYIVSDGPSQIVMGNVAYPVPQLDDVNPSGYIIAYVPIGAVSIHPSREALRDTKLTLDRIEAVKHSYGKQIQGAIQREIDACKSPAQAVQTVVQWAKYVKNSNTTTVYQYRGQPLPVAYEDMAVNPHYAGSDPSLNLPQRIAQRMLCSPVSRYGGTLGYHAKMTSIGIKQWPHTLWVHGFTPEKYTALHRRKIARLAAERGLAPTDSPRDLHDSGVEQIVCIRGGAPTTPFIDRKRVLDYEDVRKIQLQPKGNVVSVGGRIPGSYDVVTEEGTRYGLPGANFRPGVPVYWCHGNTNRGNFFAAGLRQIAPKFTLVCLPENRIVKFKRDAPQATKAQDALIAGAKAWAAALTKDQRLAMAIKVAGQKDNLLKFDGARIDDPALREAIRLANIPTTTLMEARSRFDSYVPANATIDPWVNPLLSYPLLMDRYSRFTAPTSPANMEHAYIYVNAAYAAKV